MPSQKDIDNLSENVHYDYKCVAEETLQDAVNYANTIHLIAFLLLNYIQFHNMIWQTLFGLCQMSDKPGSRMDHLRVLREKDLTVLDEYSKRLKGEL